MKRIGGWCAVMVLVSGLLGGAIGYEVRGRHADRAWTEERDVLGVTAKSSDPRKMACTLIAVMRPDPVDAKWMNACIETKL